MLIWANFPLLPIERNEISSCNATDFTLCNSPNIPYRANQIYPYSNHPFCIKRR